jgi:hypothetical protein
VPLEQTALYLETADVARVVDLLGPVFAQQCEAVSRLAAELRVSTLHGWTVVLGAEALDGLRILAEGLSRELHVTAAAVELTAAAFRWQLAPFRDGKRLRPSGFGPPPPAADEPMPLYPDAELEAYRALGAVGVPAAVALLTAEALGERAAPVSENVLRGEGGALSGHTRELRAPAHPEADPPVRLLPPTDEAPGIHFEPRAVAGRAGAQALQRLQALEEAYRTRAFEAAQQSLDIRFVYRRADGSVLDPVRETSRPQARDDDSLLARLLRRSR